MLKKRTLGQKVSPKSGSLIAKKAHLCIDVFKETMSMITESVPIVMVLEQLQHQELLELHIVEDEELGDDYAITLPAKNQMLIRNSIWEGASNGGGFERFTLAHEFGHLLLHKDETPSFARSVVKHKIYEDAEWQADYFASELLIDSRKLKICMSVEDVMKKFGVSRAAAKCRLNKLKKESHRM